MITSWSAVLGASSWGSANDIVGFNTSTSISSSSTSRAVEYTNLYEATPTAAGRYTLDENSFSFSMRGPRGFGVNGDFANVSDPSEAIANELQILDHSFTCVYSRGFHCNADPEETGVELRAVVTSWTRVADVDPNEVPEPGSLALLGIGLAGLAAASRRSH